MAIQNQTFRSAQHDWFATRSGLNTEAPLTEHMAKYFSDKGFGSNASIHKPMTQMFDDWLTSLSDDGDWAGALQSEGKVPTVNENENEFLFYTTVTTSP